MCSRLFLTHMWSAMAAMFEVSIPPVEPAPRYNIAPTQGLPCIRFNPETRQRSLDLLHFGLLPRWAKDRRIAASLVNARAETVGEKPAFRDAFRSRRCLVLASGFYEWQRMGKARQPYAFALRDNGLLVLAGIWERWRDPVTQEIVRSVAIVTCPPNDVAAAVHDRMPVIVRPEDYAAWLGEMPADEARLNGVMQPYAGTDLNCWPVSLRVSRATNEGSDLIEPVAANAPDKTLL